jgi:hypothetical protein
MSASNFDRLETLRQTDKHQWVRVFDAMVQATVEWHWRYKELETYGKKWGIW